MNRCPITYEQVEGSVYSPRGLRLLRTGLTDLAPLEYSAEEQRKEAFLRATKMSIQGVQPKLSAVLSLRDQKFEIVDRGGRYILKPQHPYFHQMPENEDLTMRMAGLIDSDVPVHGMIWSKDRSLTYFIKRFDRSGQKDKVPVEDFAQLGGKSRDTKYNYSLEKVVELVNRYCTFPAVEKVRLYKRVLFSFITGNDDMHLKNFSIIHHEGKIQLSPCYDLINTWIEYQNPEDELALPLKGRMKKITRAMWTAYFGIERCELTNKVIESVFDEFRHAVPAWRDMIQNSFLSEEMQLKYTELMDSRLKRLELS